MARSMGLEGGAHRTSDRGRAGCRTCVRNSATVPSTELPPAFHKTFRAGAGGGCERSVPTCRLSDLLLNGYVQGPSFQPLSMLLTHCLSPQDAAVESQKNGAAVPRPKLQKTKLTDSAPFSAAAQSLLENRPGNAARECLLQARPSRSLSRIRRLAAKAAQMSPAS